MIETMNRRRLVAGALALGGASLLPGMARASLPERRLAFRNVHTNERFDARYFGPSGWDAQGLAELDHGLRDWRTGETIAMDRDLLDLLVTIRGRLDVPASRPFDLISGYRSPATNGALREAGHGGVASKSQHILGKATDIAVPGITLERVRLAAATGQRGGVGFYPKDGFVHVDTGRIRSW